MNKLEQNYDFTSTLVLKLKKKHYPPCSLRICPFTQKCIVPSLVKIGAVVLEKTVNVFSLYAHTGIISP